MSFNGMHRLHPWDEKPIPWEEWYAWHPVKDIHGERHWLKKIYRRYNWAKSTEQPFGKGYDYGTIFDVLAEDTSYSDLGKVDAGPVVGTMLFDHTTNEFKIYDGAHWCPVTDTAASYVKLGASASATTTVDR